MVGVENAEESLRYLKREIQVGALGWGMNEKEGIAKQNGSSWQQTGKRDKVRVRME